MTTIALLADIHGNLPALEAVLEDIKQFDVDGIIVAGDSVNSAPFSAQVLERLVKEHVHIMRGNHEFYALEHDTPRAPQERKDFTTPIWLKKNLGAKWLNFIAALPDTLTLHYPDATSVRVVHGSPNNHFKGIYPHTTSEDIYDMLESVSEETVLLAHTHLAINRHIEIHGRKWHLINAGSVGLPLDGVPSRASYAILEGDYTGWKPTFRRVMYDNSRLFEAFEQSDLIGACGVTGRMIIEEFRHGRPYIYPFMIWWKSQHADKPDSPELAEAFLQLDYETEVMSYVPVHYRNLLETYSLP
ncbi:MAG: metallophosphoesterase family protein [bacterium]|nr:metallophosphoesterase family protein [bacterium]